MAAERYAGGAEALADGILDEPPPPTLPPHWKAWFQLCEIAPDLKKLHPPGPNQERPPRGLSDTLFTALIACFADKRRREILRAVILDVLSDDLLDVLLAPEREDDK